MYSNLLFGWKNKKMSAEAKSSLCKYCSKTDTTIDSFQCWRCDIRLCEGCEARHMVKCADCNKLMRRCESFCRNSTRQCLSKWVCGDCAFQNQCIQCTLSAAVTESGESPSKGFCKLCFAHHLLSEHLNVCALTT